MMSFHNRHCRNLGGRWWARRVVCRRAYAPFAAKWSEECTKQVGFLIGREIIVVCVRLFLQGWKKRKVIGQNKFGNWASSYGRDLDHRRICHKQNPLFLWTSPSSYRFWALWSSKKQWICGMAEGSQSKMPPQNHTGAGEDSILVPLWTTFPEKYSSTLNCHSSFDFILDIW